MKLYIKHFWGYTSVNLAKKVPVSLLWMETSGIIAKFNDNYYTLQDHGWLGRFSWKVYKELHLMKTFVNRSAENQKPWKILITIKLLELAFSRVKNGLERIGKFGPSYDNLLRK